ncbi:SDR family NAD(P)-dependent oxidoreductase [Maribacter sp. 2307ULW6-5]|uniref:SDR family NAD(P)-dependent oxidoreductase n=1 Tax=Maribacter sp. 2307ULW6-5 TaxID=3386275 RepID=UPI0039BC3D06
MEFRDKKVLITGASRGIGKATALAFAKQGAQVGLNYKSDTKAAEAVLRQMEGQGHRLFCRDIGLKEQCQALMAEFLAHYGRLDILVNNAGISIAHDVEQVDFKDWQAAWEATMATNLFAAANLSYLAARAMMASGGGRMVNVSSRGAFRGEPDHPAYGASKAALNALGQSLAKKLAPHKIYVGTVAPGFTDTEMARAVLDRKERQEVIRETPFGRMAAPEEVAHAILFLASDKAAYSSGTIIDVNGASYLRS